MLCTWALWEGRACSEGSAWGFAICILHVTPWVCVFPTCVKAIPEKQEGYIFKNTKSSFNLVYNILFQNLCKKCIFLVTYLFDSSKTSSPWNSTGVSRKNRDFEKYFFSICRIIVYLLFLKSQTSLTSPNKLWKKRKRKAYKTRSDVTHEFNITGISFISLFTIPTWLDIFVVQMRL